MAARLGGYPRAVIAPPPNGFEDARLPTGFGGGAIRGNVGRPWFLWIAASPRIKSRIRSGSFAR